MTLSVFCASLSREKFCSLKEVALTCIYEETFSCMNVNKSKNRVISNTLLHTEFSLQQTCACNCKNVTKSVSNCAVTFTDQRNIKFSLICYFLT